MAGINSARNNSPWPLVKKAAQDARVSRDNLWAALTGKKAMSLGLARKTAPYLGSAKAPVAWYLRVNTHVAKARAKESNAATALRGLAAVINELKKLDRAEISQEGPALQAAVDEMLVTVNEILAGGTDATGQPLESPLSKIRNTTDASGFNVTKASKQSRDLFGRKLPTEEDPEETATKSTNGSAQRDAFGRHLRAR